MISVSSPSPYPLATVPPFNGGVRQPSSSQSSTSDSPSPTAADAGGAALPLSAQSKVDQLKEIDRKVRAHEQAHIAAGGELIRGGVSFSYQKGPDGKLYVVGGEVSIDTSPGRTPAETVTRAQRIRSAALAPADPSPQDRQVAADAANMEASAQRDVAASQSSAQQVTGNKEERQGVGQQAVSNAVAKQMVAFYASVARSGEPTAGFSDAV